MKPLQYDEDHMPREVATEMLLSKTKLTPAIRRACKLARQRMVPSIAPVITNGDGGYAYNMKLTAKTSTEKLAAKYQKLSLLALLRNLRRVIAKRRTAQFDYVRATTDKARAACELIAHTCDEQRDALELELKRRHNRK